MGSTATQTRIRNQFGVKRRLGQALYGSVYLCHDLANSNNNKSELVAIKEVNLRDAKRRLSANPHMDNPWQERKIAEQLTALGPHDHVLSFRDNFMESGAWYIVMDYCNGGDLLGVLQQEDNDTNGDNQNNQHSHIANAHDGRFDERTALHYFAQVARGVAHLHAHGIAHRDLSLENVLLHDGVCKLSDFGLSTEADRVCNERVGKAYYMAPEVVATPAQGYDAKAADMWSLGIMLFIMLTGSPLVPLASSSEKAFVALRAFGVGKILEVWGMSSSVSASTVSLLDALLCVDASERLTVEEVLKHPALNAMP